MDTTGLTLEETPEPKTKEIIEHPPKAKTPTKPPVTRMQYHGKAGEIFRLHAMNLLMNIITMGIYSFWGKTRIRRYMTSHITLIKDRFEYTGTGKELFIGWLKAMLIFMPIIVGMQIPVINLIVFPLFLGVLSVAVYLALRYRLSRTRWRGIRFHLGGSVKEFLILSIKRSFVNIFTFGWKIPKSDILKWSYIANNISYGDIKFSYEGDSSRLQKIHALTLFTFTIPIVLTLLIGGIVKGADLINHAKEHAQKRQIEQIYSDGKIQNVAPQAGEDTGYPDNTNNLPYVDKTSPKNTDDEAFIWIALIYPIIGIMLLARLWYHAALWQEKFRGLKVGNLRFKSDVTGKGLAKLYVTNILLIIVTLGLAKPIAAQRVLRYYVTNLRIGGDLDLLIAEQSKASTRSGMGDALAADVGFDLGL